jgi:hypothetical protein
LRKSSAARACMRAGISSENSSNRRSGMGVAYDCHWKDPAYSVRRGKGGFS